MIFHDKLYGSPIPALKVCQNTATVSIQGLQQDLTWRGQTSELQAWPTWPGGASLFSSGTDPSIFKNKQIPPNDIFNFRKKKSYIYILMYGYHRKSTTAPFLGETHTFVQQVTNHYLTPISSHHKQRQLHQQGPGSKPMLLLRQPFEGKANPGNPWMFMIDKHHPYWYQKKNINFFLGGYDFKICSFHPILSSYISYTLRRLLLDMPWNKGSVDPL